MCHGADSSSVELFAQVLSTHAATCRPRVRVQCPENLRNTRGPAVAKSKQSAAERSGLLEAIRAQAREDGPRLIFADWLDDHGEPERAEFIRLQCEESRLFGTDGFTPHKGGRVRVSISGPDVR